MPPMNDDKTWTKSPRQWFSIRNLFIVAGIFIALWMVAVVLIILSIKHAETIDNVRPADVIIVLGSGLRRDGRPGDALYRRSVWGAGLYRDGIAPYVICTGGTGKGQIRSEADACREVMSAQGVPDDAIFLEAQSTSTEENARYAHDFMRTQGFEDAVLVTDSFHMFRASWIFDLEGIVHYESPVPREQVRHRFYVRHFTREILAIHWQALKTLLNLR
jgi:uncharacterized SAM-binding protein YcdF (DUF218 family)